MSGPKPLERDWVGLSEAQEFGVAYETDNLVLVGIRRPLDEILSLLGAS